MEGGLIGLAAVLILFVASGVSGSHHLSFANDTEGQLNITRDGCGVTKVCVSVPENCHPEGTGNDCLFSSAVTAAPMAPNGTMVTFQLRGMSSGYIALGLTVNASEGTTDLFICAQNSSDNGTFFFSTMQMNNSDMTLTPAETTVTEIRGSADGTDIQCEFSVSNVNATSVDSRSSHETTFVLLLGKGSIDGNSTDMIGPFNVSLTTEPLDLHIQDNSTETTTAPPTTNSPTTTMATTTVPPTSGANCVLSAVPFLLTALILVVQLES